MLFLGELDHALDYSSLKFLPGLRRQHLKCPSVLHALLTDWIPLKTLSGELLWKSEITMASELADSLLLDLLCHLFDHMRRELHWCCSLLNFPAPRTVWQKDTFEDWMTFPGVLGSNLGLYPGTSQRSLFKWKANIREINWISQCYF